MTEMCGSVLVFRLRFLFFKDSINYLLFLQDCIPQYYEGHSQRVGE